MRLILLALWLFALPAWAEPKDVRRFVANADICEHLAGEWDSDQSREEQLIIEHNIERYCGCAKRQMDILVKKYKKFPAILEKINSYEVVKEYQ